MLNGIADWLDVPTALAVIRLIIDLVKLCRPAAKAPDDSKRARSKPMRKRRQRRR